MSDHQLTREQLDTALAAARRMTDRDIDPHHLAAALLYLHERGERLVALYHMTERYLQFGLPEHELSEMRLLVDALRETEPDEDQSVEGTLPV